MVWPASDGSTTIVWADGPAAVASRMAWRRLPGPLSLVEVTWKTSAKAGLGIVTTMSSIGGGDTAEIGRHVAGALVGTFLGILLAYGFIGPAGTALEHRAHEDGKAFECVKVALLAQLRGYNPQVAVEFARKTLSSKVRPSFTDLEGHLKGAR